MKDSVGSRLKKLRKENGYTQKYIAEYLNYHQGQIAKLENDTRNLQSSSLEKLCELYGCTREYILEGKSNTIKNELAFRTKLIDKGQKDFPKMNKIINTIEFLDELIENSEK